jgi:hypothetical protein
LTGDQPQTLEAIAHQSRISRLYLKRDAIRKLLDEASRMAWIDSESLQDTTERLEDIEEVLSGE